MTDNIIDVDYPGNKTDGDFYKIGKECKSDKFYQHNYHNFYPKFIEHYKAFNDLAMLEIGIENKYSLNLWLNYYPNAYIYGADINVADEGERYKIFKIDQSNEKQLNILMTSITKPLFLILDDGSHIPEHQILSFNLLFNKLLPGGTYIIEDIETSYWSKNKIYNYETKYGYHHPNSVVEFFKLVVDDVNGCFLKDENKIHQNNFIRNRLSENTRKNISTITFTHNSIIITKKTDEEIINRPKDYYWKQNL
jgi:hypothetical protein